MKRTIFTAAAVLAMVGTAHAQQMPPLGGLYGELGYTFMKIDGGGTSGRPGAIRGLIGYDFHPMFAVEGFIGGGVMDDDKDVPGGNVNFKLKSLYGIWVKPKYVMNQLELFARLGWAHSKVEGESINPALSFTQSDDDFSWGIGANYRFTRNWYTGIDWVRYSNQSDHKVDGLTLSVGYKW